MFLRVGSYLLELTRDVSVGAVEILFLQGVFADRYQND
jgi:hypothetical protein